jgi:hypothetical protein
MGKKENKGLTRKCLTSRPTHNIYARHIIVVASDTLLLGQPLLVILLFISPIQVPIWLNVLVR